MVAKKFDLKFEGQGLLAKRRHNFVYTLYVVLRNIEIFVESRVSKASSVGSFENKGASV